MQHPLAAFHRGTVFHLIRCYFDRPPMLNLACYLKPNTVDEEDLAIAERLLKVFTQAYQEERQRSDTPVTGLWEDFKLHNHGYAYKYLLARDVRALAEYLVNALRTSWAFGLGLSSFEALSAPGDDRDANVLLIKDRLVSLAVALGILPCEYNELGRYGQNVHLPIGEVVSSIEGATTWTLARPPVMGLFGLQVPAGVLDARAPEDTYAASRLLELSKSGQVAEIGGGFGGVALQCVRAGLKPTIFDLPLINVLQGFFLAKTIGSENVSLYGENNFQAKAAVLPWWCFTNREHKFDTVFNRDSMPEFLTETASTYLKEMRERGSIYLSCNMEVEADIENVSGLKTLHVGNMANACGLRRVARFSYWFRQGFVEEVFR